MGSSSSKDTRSRGPGVERSGAGQGGHLVTTPDGRVVVSDVYGSRTAGGARGSRQDLALFLTPRGREAAAAAAQGDRPRETKQERDARRAERERQARLKERERSLKEESVDGGFLVTLGTYTGPEDFSKSIVRQLQIERRLAPFWKGLNDHSESWAEHQLVAAARGLPIPAADQVPPEMARTASQGSGRSDTNVNHLTVPISGRSQSYESGASANLSASHPAFSSSAGNSTSSTAQLFRGRAKTLASLATGSKSQSPDLTPQEIRLPSDPYVNGTPIEAMLYKDAIECPICFLYYPPYLNKTRCCDQPICSECFVQIKRPDPHPPEHEQPGQPRPPEEEAELLVSEIAACPFCVTPEFGVSYDPPPFRRGLAYAHQHSRALKLSSSAMSSSSSLNSAGGARRRATSLSANAPQVVTTDRVRPDWAKKLADARAHALRRSAAATALHNAAYVLGNQNELQLRAGMGGFGRRRRAIIIETSGNSGSGTPRGEGEDGNSDQASRDSPRRNRTRVDDLEDLMMMEAIRLSLAAEEERKRKEDKEARKDAKKREKEAKKEAKQARKNSDRGLYPVGTNDSTSTWGSHAMVRSTSNLGSPATIPEQQQQQDLGKGKAPAQDFGGFNPMTEPTSTLNTELRTSSPSARAPGALDAQRHLEESRANLPSTTASAMAIPGRSFPGGHARQLSYASSLNSSLADSAPNSLRAESALASSSAAGPAASASLDDLIGGGDDASGAPAADAELPPTEPMLNFRSLAAVIGADEKRGHNADHIEDAGAVAAPATAAAHGDYANDDGGKDDDFFDGETPSADPATGKA